MSVQAVEVIEAPAVAIVAIEPIRSRLLAELAHEPASATQLAARLGLPRQKVNYHLRALEEHGLVELAEERPRRGVTERLVRASASSYAISPAALGPASVDRQSDERSDWLSARYLLAVAARSIREVGALVRSAERVNKLLPTLTIDTEVRFRSADDRAAFTHELAAVVAELAARYHDESGARGRWHRLVVFAHPTRPAGGPRLPKGTFDD